MGCCFSTRKSKLSTSIPQKQQHSLVGIEKPRSDPKESRAPPPSIEEETVKEVLSETPKPVQLPEIPLKAETINEAEELKLKYEQKRTHKPVFEINKQDQVKPFVKQPIIKPTEEISDVSGICSLSDSVSTSTNFTRDDDDEVQQRVDRSPMKLPKRRNFSGNISPKRERLVGRSPNRRSDRSPARRNGVGSVRMGQSRESGQPMIRRSLRTEPLRHNPGEISARRSRSPATRANVGRSTSARISGNSAGRTATAPVDSTLKTVEEPSIEDKWPNNTTNESLENPLVSLECFIFL